ncbi:MAG: DUF4268 domain-containing protein, partial [Phormidesmis sp.]
TSDSILRAVSNLKSIPERLRVSHAINKVTPYYKDNDLSILLKGLQDTNAIPIVDSDRHIEAIVTSYDTAEYFRRRAEDLMLAEDIELTLRDFIKPPSTSDTDSIDQLIQAITPSSSSLKDKFKQALLSYIKEVTGSQPQFDQATLDSVFTQYLEQSSTQKTFDELTLYELTQIFKNIWPQYQAGFNDLEWNSIDSLLDEIRETRNAIAHFREVTPQQRRQLQYCATLLDNHRPSFEIEETEKAVTAADQPASSDAPHFLESTQKGSTVETTSILHPANPPEELEADDSRYAPLAIWLQQQETDRVTRTFKEIETIIDDELPPSAYNNRSWWANDSVGHVQSKQWLDVDWRVSSVNMSAERVVFSRMGDRQSAYIDFFSRLQAKLQCIEGLSVIPQNNQQGRHWLVLALSPKNSDSIKPPHVIFTFARRSRFRIESYINERERSQNKQIFDRLQSQKTEIEAEFGAPLAWERLNHRHGSRIAYYRPDSAITDDAEKLKKIQEWAIETLPKFYAVLSDRFITAQKEAINQEKH